jgi:hypothetical protein
LHWEHFFALRGCSRPEKWMAGIRRDQWFVSHNGSGEPPQPPHGPYPLDRLAEIVRSTSNGSLAQTIVVCRGLSMGFYAEHILPALDQIAAPQFAAQSGQEQAFAPEPQESEINAEYGEFTCPVCWLKFDRGDIMHIAVHGSL